MIVVYFKKDDILSNVVYDKKGNLIYALRYYSGPNTPIDVQKIVEKKYTNADITVTVKVVENGMEFFIVNLEEKSSIKQISIYNGETHLLKELTKV